LPAKGGLGVGSGSSLRQQKGKALKNYSFLIEKNLCALLKKIEIFAGFACPALAGLSRWVG
jgi:hypothetical protein